MYMYMFTCTLKAGFALRYIYISRARVVSSDMADMCANKYMLGNYRILYNRLSKAKPCLTCHYYNVLSGNSLIVGISSQTICLTGYLHDIIYTMRL